MWTAKTKFLFFSWISFYFTSSKSPYQYQNYILAASFLTKQLKISICIDIDIYIEIVWTFSQAMAQNECTKREKLGKFDSFRKLSFVSRTLLTNLKSFHTTWWKKRSRDGRGWQISIKQIMWTKNSSHEYCVIPLTC